MSNDNLKVPSQIFRWFEKMKGNYETAIQKVLAQFEQQTEKQQQRLDLANENHVANLKQAHQQQIQQQQQTIDKLHQDIQYYQQQITQQQQTIEQLNGRYDAVMQCLLAEKSQNNHFKDIFDNEEFITPIVEDLRQRTDAENTAPEKQHPIEDETVTVNTAEENSQSNSNENLTTPAPINQNSSTDGKESNEAETPNLEQSLDTQFNEAIALRQSGEFSEANAIFTLLAQQNHAKAMGALGRAYFTGEGVQQNPVTGLAWLIKAAELGLAPAITRCESIQSRDYELYLEAQTLSKQL
jgi:TPR repeat protein